MYEWRKMTEEEREQVLTERKGRDLPWHSLPHWEYKGPVSFIFTAACYEHAPIIGKSLIRMSECEKELLTICQQYEVEVFAWCILPNHYHLLIQTDRMKEFGKAIGQFHGRSSRRWNQEDNVTGRRVWCNYFERPMKSEGHFWASLNYIHHNPVKHEYADRWQDWPFSSAHQFLEDVGRDRAVEIWRNYPVLDYGKDWDW